MASHDFVYSCDDDSYPKDSANLRAAMQYMLDNPRVCTLTTNVIDISTGISHCQGYAEFAWSGSAEQGYIGHFLLGGGTIMRRKCLTQVEGYPENFFWGREEADLSLQLLAQGCTLAYHPGFVTIHDRSGSGIKGSRWVYYYTRNPIWTAWRFFSPGTALRLSASWTLRCLFTHMPRGLAWTAGVFDALRGIPRLRNYREQLVRNAPAAGIELFCRHAYGDTISLRSVARRLFGANRLSPHKVWNRPAK
jgi:GT2 family glycosyltransferase